MCASGMCADGYALFAVVDTGHSRKAFQLNATTLSAAEREALEKKDPAVVLLYIESRRIGGP